MNRKKDIVVFECKKLLSKKVVKILFSLERKGINCLLWKTESQTQKLNIFLGIVINAFGQTYVRGLFDVKRLIMESIFL